MLYFHSIIGKAVHALVSGLVGSVVKSPIEEDFGEAHPEDIEGPEAAFASVLGAVQLADILEAFSRKSCGEIRHEPITRAVRRLAELPLGRRATLHLYFGRKDADDNDGALQIAFHKHAPKSCNVCFRGSEEVIDTIRQIDAIRGEFGR
jgi:hypothetical protein